MPLDNAEEYGTPVVSYTAVPGMPTGLLSPTYTVNGENEQIEVWINPAPAYFLYGTNSLDWAVATVATAGVGIAVGVIASPAVGVGYGVFGIVSSIAGYQVTSNLPVSIKRYCTNDLASWRDAVRETNEFVNQQNSTADVRVDPPSLLSGYAQADEIWEDNPLWRQATMTPWVKQVFEARFFRGDDYDAHGYTGPGRAHLKAPTRSPQLLAYYTFPTSSGNPE